MRERITLESLDILKNESGFKRIHSFEVESQKPARATLGLLPENGLAIVGSRTPQRRSIHLLKESISKLKHSNLIIISGFARGIDSYAHEFAIENGLQTIAIIGTGLDIDYPKENKGLREKILSSGGLIVSPFAAKEPPLPGNFPKRNGLIAGFSKASWVVEAAEVSGTLNTANWAMNMNRQVFATPAFPNDPFYLGNQKLLSHRDTQRYPIAEPFYGPESLSSCWPELFNATPELRLDFKQSNIRTRIPKWVVEIESEFGACPIQVLMNRAYEQGLTLGDFYREFEKEIQDGSILQVDEGHVRSS